MCSLALPRRDPIESQNHSKEREGLIRRFFQSPVPTQVRGNEKDEYFHGMNNKADLNEKEIGNEVLANKKKRRIQKLPNE